MRHGKKKGRINRRTSYRKATLKSLANDLFKYQRIETTLAKAKALRSFAEPLITLAKNNSDSVTARRRAFQKLCDKDVVKSLFSELAPLYRDVPGGYTRIMPLGTRRGDGAQLVIMELTKRTIPDEELLGISKEKELARKKKKKKEKAPEEKPEEKEKHAAPEVEPEEKEERAVEEAKKEKAKTEQKKVEKKGERRGFFRRFQRKSFGPSQ